MSDTQNATPAEMLERHITDPCIPKSEAEWWAHREIERLRASNERLHRALFRIAGKAPLADDPWTIAAKALEREAKP